MDGWNLGPVDPLQWICREWIQELGFDKAIINADVKDDRVGTKNTELDGFTIRGKELLIQGYEFSSSLTHQEHNGGIYAPLPKEPNPPLLWKISCIIYLFLVHPSPTLVSHPCPYLSARPISHSFWRPMSCCDPDSTVQGSCPHKWGQDVSRGYLMRRWQPLLELLLYHALMVGPLRSGFPLGCSRRLPLVVWRFPLPWSRFAEDKVVLGSISRQSGLSLFVLGHFFLLNMGHGLDMK